VTADPITGTADRTVLAVEGGTFVRQGNLILDAIDWTVRPGERWTVLGANGAGKTTLLRIASTYESLTAGTTTVLAQRVGTVDVRVLRKRIALVSNFIEDVIPPRTRALDVVVMGRDARLMRWHESYDPADLARASELLALFDCADFEDAQFGLLSDGQRQRVQLARAMMTDPELLLLDEPTAGLDLVGREMLLATLGGLARMQRPAGIVLVTHHPEEIPPGFTHSLLLRDGQVVAAGPIDDTITSAHISACFDAPLRVERRDERFTVRLADGH
jgi:iron complex transport system ATP-binding protein